MTDRAAWIDALRAFAVVAVVLFHVVLFMDDADLAVDTVTAAAISELGALRMPLLFVISGWLLSRTVAQGIRSRPVLLSASRSYYFYGCWLVIYFLVCLFLPAGTTWRISGPADLLSQAFVPDTPLWYLFGLSACTVLLAAVRRLHAGIVIGALAVVAVATGFLPPSIRWWALGSQMLAYAVFFAVGARLPSLITALTQGAVAWKLAAALAALLVMRITTGRAPSFLVKVPLDLGLAAAAIAVAVCLAHLLTRTRTIAAISNAIGRRTLPVYVLHIPILWVLFAEEGIATTAAATVGAAAPYLLCGSIVTVALIAHAIVIRVPLAALVFRAPGWLSRPAAAPEAEAEAAGHPSDR